MLIIRTNQTVEISLGDICETFYDLLGAGTTMTMTRTVGVAAVYCDDDGMRNQRPYNLLASGLAGQPILGDVLVLTLAESFDDSDDQERAEQARALSCPTCHGSGAITDEPRTRLCPECMATGVRALNWGALG